MAKLPSIHLQSMQADSLVQAAINGGKNFERAALSFFKTSNDAYPTVAELLERSPKDQNVYSNGVVALFSAINKAEKEMYGIKKGDSIVTMCRKLFGDNKSVRDIVIDAVDAAGKKNHELKAHVSKFFFRFKKAHPKSWQDRMILAENGCVKADGSIKPKRSEKFMARINSYIADEV